MNSTLAYFAVQGRMSDPGMYVSLYEDLPASIEDLPASIEDLVKLVQGVTIHVFWTERYGYKAPRERMEELQLRSMSRRLERTLNLDPRPLTERRPVEKKLLGNCRDHSLLLASLLRHQGIPARARCGFADYFMPNHFEDHWVVEYWNKEHSRWIFVDAQLDELQRDVLMVNFDVLDVPRDRFLVGGRAWQMCRSGEQDPAKFGIFQLNGLGFVRGNMVRDIASLNKMELLPWDCWGVILNESLHNADDLAILDDIASLTAGDVPDFDVLCSRYESDPRLYMNGSLFSHVNGSMVEINVA